MRDLSNNQSLDNKNTKVIVSNLMAPTTDQQILEILQRQFRTYVTEEYQACMTQVKRRLLRRLSGVYKVDPFPKSKNIN